MANTTSKSRKTAQSAKELVLRVARKNIHHDGEEYAPGDEIQMTAAQALQLDEVGALEPAKVEPAKVEPDKVDETSSEHS